MAYRLIVLDLDGTLMSEDVVISPRARQAIQRAINQGITVTLASGRAYPSMLPYVEELGVTAPVICYQGSKIQIPAEDGLLYHATIPLPLARTLLDYAQERGLDATVYVDDHIYTRELRRSRDFYDRWFGLPLIIVKDLAANLPDEPTKVLIIGESEENDHLLPELQGRYGASLQVVRSHDLFVEAMAPGVSKGSAMSKVASYLRIPQAETMAIGDAGNDIEMVAWAGLGVAMGNAAEGVKAVADYIAPPVSEDGAAVAIETFCLNGD